MGAIALTGPRWGTGLVMAILLIATLHGRPAGASTGDEGRPVVRALSPKDYEGAAPVDRLAIAPDGTLVAACGSDVVTYDGVRFDRIETAIPRIGGLAISRGGTHIYAGGAGQLGVIDRDPGGFWYYRSLLAAIPTDARPIGRVTGIVTAGDDAWFATQTKLFRYADRSFTAIRPPGPGTLSVFAAGDEVYVHRARAGLYRIVDAQLMPVTTDPLVANGTVVGVFGAPDALVIAERDHGLLAVASGHARALTAHLAPAERFLAAARTADGYALGAETGLVVADESGTVTQRVAEGDGLSGDAVEALAVDRDGSIWVGAGGGLAQVSLLGAVTRFDGRDGLPAAAIGAIARHAGRIVVAAGDGLYALQRATEAGGPARFEKLSAAIPRPHDLLAFGGWLFASGSGGVWRIENGRATPVVSLPGDVTDLAPWGPDRGILLAARTTGLSVLRLLGDRLVELRSFTDLGDVRSIAEDDKGAIWLGTTSRGIHHIVLEPGSPWDSARVTTYDAKNGRYPDAEEGAMVGRAPGGVFAASTSHVFRYEGVGDAFRPDDRFAVEGMPLSRLWPVATSGPHRFWANASLDAHRSDFPLARFERAPGGLWKLVTAPAPILDGLGFAGASAILLEPGKDEEIVWAAGRGELYRMRAADAAPAAERPTVAVLSASGAGRLRNIDGTGRDRDLADRIPHSRDSLRFVYGAASLLPGARVEYHWRLEGWSDAWSAWSSSREAVFSSLPAGSYRFVVEARDRAGASSHPASVGFRMLPPVWFSWWAWSGYGVLTALFFWGAVRLRLVRVEAESRRLEQVVAKRTDEAAQSREAAEEAERAKSRFLVRMSDELKTPVDAILALAQALEHDPELATKYIERIGALKASGSHLLTLLDEIVELTHVESGHVEIRKAAFSLAALLRDVETAFVAQARERGLRFQVATRDLPRLHVRGDAPRIRQVLEHLIGGAMRLTEHGEVRLTVIGEPRSGRVHFAVSDTGPGVTPDEPESELGLAMSRQIVELMGARLETAGRAGEGSTAHFSIRLPEAEDEPARPAVARTWLDAARVATDTPPQPGA